MKPLFLISYFAFLLYYFSLPAYASQWHTELDTVPVTDDTSIDMELSDVEIRNKSISCFGVNQNGYYAIGFASSPKNIVSVYNSEKEFLYGYRFPCDGTFSIELTDNNTLLLYLTRSSLLAEFDEQGQCLYIAQVPVSRSNMYYIRDVFESTHKTAGYLSYALERDFPIGPTYSRLVMVDAQGNEHMLYDVTPEHTIVNAVACAVVIALVFFAARAAIKDTINRENM